MSGSYPILEFDPATKAVIEPGERPERNDVPKHCVICFFRDVVENLPRTHRCRELDPIHVRVHGLPAYELDWEGKKVTVFFPGMGAPLTVGLTEQVIASGCRKFIACGTAGVLDAELVRGHLIVPTTAVRDEGTSYHYVAPSREVVANPEAVAAIRETLESRSVRHLLGKTWTTDAFYRETPDRVSRRKAEGCIAVEMEAAALFALAQFRKLPIGHVLWADDDVSGDDWDHRQTRTSVTNPRAVFDLAVEACLRL